MLNKKRKIAKTNRLEKINKLIAQIKKDDKPESWSSVFTVISITGVMIGILSIVLTFQDRTNDFGTMNGQLKYLETQRKSILLIDSLKQSLEKYSLYTTLVNDTILLDGKKIDKTVRSELDKVKADVTTLNEIILEDPEKAISLVLTKKEVENLKSTIDRLETSTKNELSKIYDLFKWIIGIFCALMFALISLAYSNVFFRKKDAAQANHANEIETLKMEFVALKQERESSANNSIPKL